MNLPVLNDNLRSSASWMASLAEEREAWAWGWSATAEARLREYQTEQMLNRSGEPIDRARLAEAINKIAAWAVQADAELSAERLLDLHRTLTGAAAGADVLRKTEAAPINAAHDPTPAILLPRMIDNAFDWFAAESFGQLHAVEQATVAYLRLLDLHPFLTLTEPTAMLAASFYTERGGLPPLVVSADEVTQARFAQALEAAMRMLTQPLVELFAELLRATMRQVSAPVATG